jgi:hypothetical protein
MQPRSYPSHRDAIGWRDVLRHNVCALREVHVNGDSTGVTGQKRHRLGVREPVDAHRLRDMGSQLGVPSSN